MKRILIVEDGVSTREQMKALFEERGYKVTIVGSSKAIGDIFSNNVPLYDAILSDYDLDEFDNYRNVWEKMNDGLIAQRKAGIKLTPIPFLVMSNVDRYDIQTDVIDGFLRKPNGQYTEDQFFKQFESMTTQREVS